MDAVADKGEIVMYAISEHIEFAGVHSGDATIQFPAQKLYVETVRRIKRISKQIAKELNISGPFNIQYLAKGNEIKVIECNLLGMHAWLRRRIFGITWEIGISILVMSFLLEGEYCPRGA